MPLDSARLPALASAWEGTPFRDNMAVRGVGASCHHLPAALLAEAGLDVGPVPEGAARWSGRVKEHPMEAFLDAHSGFARAPAALAAVQAGDVLGFQVGRHIAHLGLAVGQGWFVHSLRHSGVAVRPLSDPTWSRHLAAVWRPVELLTCA